MATEYEQFVFFHYALPPTLSKGVQEVASNPQECNDCPIPKYNFNILYSELARMYVLNILDVKCIMESPFTSCKQNENLKAIVLFFGCYEL